MQITKNKNVFSRLMAVFIAAFVTTIIFAFSSVTLNTKAVDTVELVNEVAAETITVDGVEIPVIGDAYALTNTDTDFEVVQLAASGGAAGGGTNLDNQNDGDAEFEAVIRFFVKWIKRVGLLIAFVGGIMFALAIKNNDAEQKQNGLLTLVAGFVVSALCQAVDMFNIFD